MAQFGLRLFQDIPLASAYSVMMIDWWLGEIVIINRNVSPLTIRLAEDSWVADGLYPEPPMNSVEIVIRN